MSTKHTPELTDAELDASFELSVVQWEGRLHCVYLNDSRIAGGKPWGGGTTARRWDNVTLREIIRAFPALQRALGLNYLGRRVQSEDTALSKSSPQPPVTPT